MATSKTARASEVKNAPEEKVKLTPEKAIQEIRNLRAGKLAVLNVEYIDLLLGQYDAAIQQNSELTDSINNTHAELVNEKAAVIHLGQATAGLLKRAEDAELQLANEIGNHKDTEAELSALLDRQPPPAPDLEPLSKLLLKLAPTEIIEDEPITAAAIRVLGILKDTYDSDAVTIHDLMQTVKRQEKELLKHGVIIDPNPGVDVTQFIDMNRK